jgi:large subunit ribosomal protein L24
MGCVEGLVLFAVYGQYFFMFSESEKDTKASEVTKISFEPTLKTFEMDIMEQMGIQEDRVPSKTYWY